jgi:hypothetical protein
MIVSIMQPAYLPWLGYFDRIAISDLHIVLDSVMLERSSKTRFTNRNKIRTPEGWAWLTVPIRTARRGQPLIQEVEIDNEQPWTGKHWRSLAQTYSKAPFFAEHRAWFEAYYQRSWTCLAPLLRESTEYLLDAFHIGTPRLYSSELKILGQKSDLILSICRYVGAKAYLSGPFGRDYLDHDAFAAAGIELIFHDYSHPVYSQVHPGFEQYMSAIDLLFNHGQTSRVIMTEYKDIV